LINTSDGSYILFTRNFEYPKTEYKKNHSNIYIFITRWTVDLWTFKFNIRLSLTLIAAAVMCPFDSSVKCSIKIVAIGLTFLAFLLSYLKI
jgi:hypothetical protein